MKKRNLRKERKKLRKISNYFLVITNYYLIIINYYLEITNYHLIIIQQLIYKNSSKKSDRKRLFIRNPLKSWTLDKNSNRK